MYSPSISILECIHFAIGAIVAFVSPQTFVSNAVDGACDPSLVYYMGCFYASIAFAFFKTKETKFKHMIVLYAMCLIVDVSRAYANAWSMSNQRCTLVITHATLLACHCYYTFAGSRTNSPSPSYRRDC